MAFDPKRDHFTTDGDDEHTDPENPFIPGVHVQAPYQLCMACGMFACSSCHNRCVKHPMKWCPTYQPNTRVMFEWSIFSRGDLPGFLTHNHMCNPEYMDLLLFDWTRCGHERPKEETGTEGVKCRRLECMVHPERMAQQERHARYGAPTAAPVDVGGTPPTPG